MEEMQMAFLAEMEHGSDLLFPKLGRRPSVPLEGLKPISIQEIQLNRGVVEKGSVLHASLSKNPKWDSCDVVSEIKDRDGAHIPVKFSFCFESKEDIHSRLPRGGRIAIKEPELKGRMLNVVAMSSMEIISHYSEKKLGELAEMKAGALRKYGNREFGEQHYHLAIELYGLSLEAAKRENLEDSMVLASSNRAECFLRLDRFEDALSDTESALRMDAHHVKSLVRKARALQGLHCYSAARETLEQAAELGDDSIASALETSRKLEEQSVGGTHDISEFVLMLSKGLDCGRVKAEFADYVGDVEIRMTGRRGRAVFACNDFRIGELIMVSNALVRVAAQGIGSMLAFGDMFVRTVDRLKHSPQAYRQFQGLANTHITPCVSDYKPNMDRLSSTDAYLSIDIHQVAEALNVNSFDEELEPGKSGWHRLVVLPSFVNHSCVPNVCMFSIGGAQFVRAARDIRAGEELVFCYMHAGAPLQLRAKEFLMRGFECNCIKCMVEMRSKGLFHAVSSGREDDALVLESKMDSLRFDQESKQVVRCAFMSTYVRAYPNKELPPAEVVMQAVREYAGGQPWVLSSMDTLVKYAGDLKAAKHLMEEEVVCRFGREAADVMMEHILANIQKLNGKPKK